MKATLHLVFSYSSHSRSPLFQKKEHSEVETCHNRAEERDSLSKSLKSYSLCSLSPIRDTPIFRTVANPLDME